MWTQDDDRDLGTEGGHRLSGRSHGGDGEVLLEVKMDDSSYKTRYKVQIKTRSVKVKCFLSSQGVMALRPRSNQL